jgi:hypothetical protein
LGEGDAGEAKRLVLGQLCTWNGLADFRADRGKPICHRLPVLGGMPKAALDAIAVTKATAKEETSVLADHAVHGPHPRHLIAPTGGCRGHRNNRHAGPLQPLERVVGLRRKTPLIGEGFIHVGQDETDVAEYRTVRF